MPELKNLKRERFCREYAISFNATQSAIKAGYSKKTAKSFGSELLTFPDVKGRLKELIKPKNEKLEITADRIRKEMAALAFSDIRDLLDENGRLKPVSEWPDDAAVSISGLEVEQLGEKAGFAVVKKLKRWDKRQSLETLARIEGMFEKDNSQKRPQVTINQDYG